MLTDQKRRMQFSLITFFFYFLSQMYHVMLLNEEKMSVYSSGEAGIVMIAFTT